MTNKSKCATTCDHCGYGSRVIDSRQHDSSLSVRRRRQCENCGWRWNTYEMRLTEGDNTALDALKRILSEIEIIAAALGAEQHSERLLNGGNEGRRRAFNGGLAPVAARRSD